MIKDIFSLAKTKIEKAIIIAILVFFLVTVFFIPSFSALPVYNYITIGFVGILCLLILIWKFIYRRILFDRFAIFIICFNVCIFISNLLNRDSSFIFTYLTISGMAFCLYQLFIEKEFRRILRILMFIGFFAFAVYFIISYRSVIFIFSIDRIGEKFDNLNTVGYYFTYAYAITLSIATGKKRSSYLLLLPLSIPLLLFMFLSFRTGSRSSLLIILICTFVYPFICMQKLNKKNFFIPILIDCGMLGVMIAAVVVAKAAFGVDIMARMGEFFSSLVGKSIDYSSENRIELFLQSFRLFLRKPLTGWGNNVFSIYSSERLFAHNNITELLCSFGVLGFASFEVLLVSPFLTFIDTKEKSETYIMAMLLTISMFFVQFFYVNSQLKYDWILLSFIYSEAKLIKMSNEPKIHNDDEKNENQNDNVEVETFDLSI